MSELDPVVRYLIVCDDVKTDLNNPHRISLLGLIHSIRSLEHPPYPLLHREICVFLEVTACRGAGDGRIEIRHADSDQVVFRTRTRTILLSNDPLEVVGFVFRIRNCLFPEPGLHWIQFWYNEKVIAQQALVLR